MIKALIFDFDGVIAESADIKTEAFADVFSDFPQFKEDILAYHQNNMGISRFVKFKYFYESLFHMAYTDEIGQSLSNRFSEIVIQKIIDAPFVRGADVFLQNYSEDYLCFIASGTPEEEMNLIAEKKNLSQYFKEIHGSPHTKPEIVADILERYSIQKEEAVFIGDAMSDYNAAYAAEVHFIGRIAEQDIFPARTMKLNDLVQLEKVLKTLN